MTSLRRFLLPVLLAMSVQAAQATENQHGIWAVFSTSDSFPSVDGDSRWSYAVDAQARYLDFGSGINQYLIRPAIGYRPGDNFQLWLGYARIRSRGRGGITVDEDRFFQQLNWSVGRMLGGAVTMRTRLLQRSIDVSDDTGLVLRFMTKYARPINGSDRRSLILSLEPFVNLRDTEWSGSSGIAQNRTYAGVGWRLSRDLTIETGYLNQYIFRDTAENVMNHLAVVNFRIKF